MRSGMRQGCWPALIAGLIMGLGQPAAAARIELQLWIDHTPDEEAQFRELTGRFSAARPGVDVQVVNSGGGYYDKLRTAIAAGAGPDVFYVRPGTDLFLIEEGFAQSLDALVRRDAEEIHVDDFIDAQRAELMHEGKWWALPYDYSVIGLFYVPQLFDEAGVPYPEAAWTWEDLGQAARRLTVTDGSGRTSRFGMLNLTWYMSQWFEGFVMSHGGRVFTPDYRRADVNNPGAVAALEVPYALINERHAAPKPGEADVWGGFVKGIGAMTLAGSWDTLAIRNSAPFVFDTAMLPAGPGGRRVVSATGGAWAMAAQTPHPDQAWDLIKFLASPAAATELIVNPMRSLPPRKSLMRAWAERILATGSAPQHAFALADQAMRFGRNVPVLGFNAAAVYARYRDQLFSGQISPQEAAIRIEHDLNVEFDRIDG
ncbi:MAG TPA: extracellular solute-binding protein [Limnochordia bacterium]